MLKMLEICRYNIVLLYNQLYSYIMIYTNVLFIVHWCTYMSMHLYSEQYFYTSSMDHSLYLYKGKAQGGGYFILYTHGCTNAILTSDKTLKMNNLPFADLSENAMLDVLRADCCNEPSTHYLETNNDKLIGIDPDLRVYTNTVEKQCHNYDTSVDFKLKYGSQNSLSHIIWIIWTCHSHLLAYVRHGQHH